MRVTRQVKEISSCYGEPTRDAQPDTIASQLKFFVPAGWKYSTVFGDQGETPSVQNLKILKTETISYYLSYQLQGASQQQAVWSKQFNGG